MISIEMPIKEFTFFKQYYDTIDRFVVRVSYSKENVVFEIPEDKFDDFVLEYRSVIIRKGTDGKEAISDIGLRLSRIFNSYILPDPLLK